MGIQWWQVIGGETDGIAVREGCEPSSAKLPTRLQKKAVVEEDILVGNSLSFKRLKGKGPDYGWVDISSNGKDVIVRVGTPKNAKPAPPKPVPPQVAPAPEDPGNVSKENGAMQDSLRLEITKPLWQKWGPVELTVRMHSANTNSDDVEQLPPLEDRSKGENFMQKNPNADQGNGEDSHQFPTSDHRENYTAEQQAPNDSHELNVSADKVEHEAIPSISDTRSDAMDQVYMKLANPSILKWNGGGMAKAKKEEAVAPAYEDNWIPNQPSWTWRLGGRWRTSQGKSLLIAGETITWKSKVKTKITATKIVAKNKNTFTMEMSDQVYEARLVDEKLIWNDGDVWTHEDSPLVPD